MKLIAEFFFDEAHGGEEILFAVDDACLAEMSGLSEEEAVRSLASAVALELSHRWSVGNVVKLVERWRRIGVRGPHPGLPLLALTVLAASRMGSDVASPG
jgi:hypothetical protein